MTHSKGFVLLMTLGIILMVSMLLLVSMQHVVLHYKAMNQKEIQQRRFYQLEHLANQLGKRPGLFSSEGSCFIHHGSANQILNQLRAGQGCSLVEGDRRYRYLINDFGYFPCLVVQKNNQEYATHHYGISLLEEDKAGEDLVLQLRFIQLGGAMECVGEKHFVGLGLGSWRYIASCRTQ